MKIVEYINKYYSNDYYIDKYYNHIVSKITDDSRNVIENSVFVAIKGYKNSGTKYIIDAINKGAKTIFINKEEKIDEVKELIYNQSVNLIFVNNTKIELARLLKWYYHKRIKPIIIGVTGTNGKTSITTNVFEILKGLNEDVLLIGTNGNYSFYQNQMNYNETLNTTPSITTIYDLMYQKKYKYVVMEVSSQGICEKRVLGIDFDILCYSNITQDHLDYHKTMLEYFHAKEQIALSLRDYGILIINSGMSYFEELNSLTIAKTFIYGKIDSKYSIFNNLGGKISNFDIGNMLLEIIEADNNEKIQINTKLIGNFNLENILATYAILKNLNIKQKDIVKGIEQLVSVQGRMNVFKLNEGYVVVDFAHSPDGIKQVIDYFKSLNQGKIITVIGCGGNRDKLKRSIIGKLTTVLSDYVIFTEDNSRQEALDDIIFDITNNLDCNNYEIITSRRDAIDVAISKMGKNDIVLLLGKGNEEYIIKNTIVLFSDLKYIIKVGGVRING